MLENLIKAFCITFMIGAEAVIWGCYLRAVKLEELRKQSSNPFSK